MESLKFLVVSEIGWVLRDPKPSPSMLAMNPKYISRTYWETPAYAMSLLRRDDDRISEIVCDTVSDAYDRMAVHVKRVGQEKFEVVSVEQYKHKHLLYRNAIALRMYG